MDNQDSPERILFPLCKFQLLIQRNMIRLIREYIKNAFTPPQSRMAIKPLVVNGSQGAIPAFDTGNDEQLMALIPSCESSIRQQSHYLCRLSRLHLTNKRNCDRSLNRQKAGIWYI